MYNNPHQFLRGLSLPLFLAVALLFSCNGRNSGIRFELLRHVALDESSILLQYPPQQIFALAPERILALTGASATIYNTFSGKVVRQFSADTTLDDQLLAQCRVTDSLRGMVYLQREASADPNATDIFAQLSRVQGIYAQDTSIYLIYYVSVRYHFRTYAEYAALYGNSHDSVNAAANEKARNYPPEKIVIADSRVFLIETDTLFNIRKTALLDFRALPKSKWGQYHFLPEQGFAVYKNGVFAFAHNQDAMFVLPDTMLLQSKDSLTLLGEMNYSNQLTWVGERCNTSIDKNYKVNAARHCRQYIRFRLINDTLLFQSTAGWRELNGNPYRIQPVYTDDEVEAGDFDIQNNTLLYVTKNTTKNLDSMFTLKVVDAQDHAVISDTLMKGGGYFGKHHSQYFFVNPDGENYFLDVYELKQD